MGKQVIYETSGRAREFNELAINLFDSCDHNCLYCFSPDVLHKTKEVFNNNVKPRLTTDNIEKSAIKWEKKGETRRILLSFVCDVYCNAEAKSQITRSTIEILHKHNLNVSILTKGGKRSMRDFDLLTPKDSYAATLTLTTDVLSKQWESGAALPSERILALKTAHDLGIETWVSFEPVIFPEETFKLLDLTREFTGHYKCGNLNYHPQGLKTNWYEYGWNMKKRMDAMGVRYYFKRDLLKKMGVNPEEFKQTWVCG